MVINRSSTYKTTTRDGYKVIRDTAPTVVKKITFLNEEELQAGIQAEIDAQLVNHHTIYKFSQLIPINDSEANVVLTPDLDKFIVSFLDTSRETKDSLPNGELLAIMTYHEIEMLKKAEPLYIADGMFEIDHINYSMLSPTWRSVDVFLVDAIEAVEA